MAESRFKVFFQVFYSYMMILLIPLAFIAAIYGATSRAIEQNSREQAEITLSTVANTVEMRVRELDAICTYLESSPELDALLESGEISYRSGERMYDVFRLVKSLPDFSQANTMVSSVRIVLKNGKYVLASGSAVPYNARHFSVGFPQIGQDFEQFNQLVLEQVHSGDFVTTPLRGGGGVSCQLWYVRTLFSPSQSRQAGVIMIQVNPAFFSEIFSSLAQDQPGRAAIISDDGQVVASCYGTGGQEEFSDGIELLSGGEIPEYWRDNLVIGTEPDSNGWSYYYIVPRKGMTSGMGYIRPIIAFLALASLVVGAGLAVAAAGKKSRTLAKTIGAIRSSSVFKGLEEGEGNVYAYLETAVGRLVEENQDMAADIRQQKALLRASSFQKILDGDYSSPEELNQLMGEVHIPMGQRPFRMILLQNRPGQKVQDPELARIYQKNLLIEAIPCEIRFFDISESRLAVLAWTEGPEGMDGLEGQLLEVISSLRQEHQIAVAAALGDSHSNPGEISRAYRELLRLGEFFDSFPESSLITSKDLPDTHASFYYPPQLELDLMRRIQEGDEEAVQELSQVLYEENMLRRRISPAMLRQLNTVVKGSLLRGLKEFLARPDTEPLSRKLYMAETLEDMTAAVLDICRFQREDLSEGKRGQQQELKKKVVAYIQNHYQDSSLSVSRAAEELGMGESALYQFFRENMTTTFGDMLESVRIQAACTLLKQKKMSIKAVAEQVGYNSDTSFRRAFKRVMHVTPGEYSQ